MTTLEYTNTGPKVSPFEIIRHKLSESPAVLIDFFEIKNPLEGKPGAIVYYEDDMDSYYFECKDLEQGLKLYIQMSQSMKRFGEFAPEYYKDLYLKAVYVDPRIDTERPWFFPKIEQEETKK